MGETENLICVGGHFHGKTKETPRWCLSLIWPYAPPPSSGIVLVKERYARCWFMRDGRREDFWRRVGLRKTTAVAQYRRIIEEAI